MNKKGFTLMELLAVIVILGVVATIATVSMTGIQRKTKIQMFSEKVEFAVSAAQKHFEKKENKNSLATGPQSITVGQLIASNEYEIEETDASGNKTLMDINNNNINGLTICAYMKYNRVYACVPGTDQNKEYLNDIISTNVVSYDYICSADITC